MVAGCSGYRCQPPKQVEPATPPARRCTDPCVPCVQMEPPAHFATHSLLSQLDPTRPACCLPAYLSDHHAPCARSGCSYSQDQLFDMVVDIDNYKVGLFSSQH